MRAAGDRLPLAPPPAPCHCHRARPASRVVSAWIHNPMALNDTFNIDFNIYFNPFQYIFNIYLNKCVLDILMHLIYIVMDIFQ